MSNGKKDNFSDNIFSYEQGKLVRKQMGYKEVFRGKNTNQVLSEIFDQEFVEYRKRWDAASTFQLVTDFPLHMDLEIISACNLSCPMCCLGVEDFKRNDKFYGQSMSFELFKRIIDEGAEKGLKSIRTNSLGEPLLVKDYPEWIRYARERGVLDTFTFTNGMLLNETMARRLIESGGTRLLVSIDAYTEETYQKVRRGGNLSKVVSNIHRFLELRDKMKSRLPLLRVNFLLNRYNINECDAFCDYWSNYADSYCIQPMMISDYGNIEQKEMLVEEQKKDQQDPVYRCTLPWTRCMVYPDGDVCVCDSTHMRQHAIGNAYENDIETIWKSKAYQEYRELCRDADYGRHSACKQCIECMTFV